MIKINRNKKGLLIIATNKYKTLVVDFLKSVDKHFFKDENVQVYLFTDDFKFFDELDFTVLFPRLTINMLKIPSYKFPDATLLRYKIFSDYSKVFSTDYLFYSDVDMKFVDDVAEEILPTDEEGITATRHPAFFTGGWGSHGTHQLSKAYIPVERRIKYFCGGFQGGTKEAYLKAAEIINNNIIQDFEKAKEIGYTDNNGILAEWHDETHFNSYLLTLPLFKELTSEYCMVEQVYLRNQWGISHLRPKLLALEKNHKEIRG